MGKLIELQEDKEDVKKILTKVVELCPQEWKFWLSLINLSNYKEAKDLINKARKLLKSNPQVWITAAKIEERNNKEISSEKLTKMLEKGMNQLKENSDSGNMQSKQEWLDEAKKAELEGYYLTCKAIVLNSLNIDVPNELTAHDKQAIYFGDAKRMLNEGANVTANYIYEYITTENPNDIDNWLNLFAAFKKSNKIDFVSLSSMYEKAITLNKEVALFRLMYAKDKWRLENDIPTARGILQKALIEIPEDEEVWFANLKFEVQTKNISEADKISKNMLKAIPSSSPRVWFKYIHFQRFLNHVKNTNNYQDLLDIADEAISLFPQNEKLYLQKAQILSDDLDRVNEAKEVYSIGINNVPESPKLWLGLANIYRDRLKVLIRARSILDSAIVKLPNEPSLWVAKIMTEVSNKDLVAARQLCNKALKQFNLSLEIWIQYLSLIAKLSQKKNAFLDALKATNNSSEILLFIGIFFWEDGKILKAKSWFERALDSEKDDGDIWAWLNYFYSKHGTSDDMQQFKSKFETYLDNINKGKIWLPIAKAVSNLDKSPKEILEIVTKKLPLEYSL